MAEYTINFHLPNGDCHDSYTWNVWLGNRHLSNRAAISMAQTFYSALGHRDRESKEALWMCLGNDAEAKMNELLASGIDWGAGAATMDYPMNGRVLTAVFTLNAELGQKFCPLEEMYAASADRGFQIAFESVRRAV